MIRIFNKSNPPRKFLFINGEQEYYCKPGDFANLDDGFRADGTFQMALAAGDIVEYEDVSKAKQLEKDRAAEKSAEEPVPDGIEEGNAKARGRKATKG